MSKNKNPALGESYPVRTEREAALERYPKRKPPPKGQRPELGKSEDSHESSPDPLRAKKGLS